jgi:hypothetical protein
MTAAPTGEIRCVEVVGLLGDHLERALPPARSAQVAAHLLGCRGCSALLEQLRTTIALLGALGDPGPAT